MSWNNHRSKCVSTCCSKFTDDQVKDDRRSRYPLEQGTYLIWGMGAHVSKVSLKYLFKEISKDSSEISILEIVHYIIRENDKLL